MKNINLGEFEELILLGVAFLGTDAYAVKIQLCVEQNASRPASMGAVYTALDRLEEKGFLRSHLGEVTRQRGGRRKRFYDITGSGSAAVVKTRQARERMWAGINMRPEFQFGF